MKGATPRENKLLAARFAIVIYKNSPKDCLLKQADDIAVRAYWQTERSGQSKFPMHERTFLSPFHINIHQINPFRKGKEFSGFRAANLFGFELPAPEQSEGIKPHLSPLKMQKKGEKPEKDIPHSGQKGCCCPTIGKRIERIKSAYRHVKLSALKALTADIKNSN